MWRLLKTPNYKIPSPQRKKPTIEELKAAAAPLNDLLHRYYHPHAYAVVTEGCVEIVEGDMVATLPLRD